MKKCSLAMPVVLATMLIAPGSTLAATHIPTNVIFDGSVEASDGDGIYSGHVESPNRHCSVAALMRLVADDEAVDFDYTSLNGAWAMKTDSNGVSDLHADLAEFRFGRKGHRKVCDADTVTIPLA